MAKKTTTTAKKKVADENVSVNQVPETIQEQKKPLAEPKEENIDEGDLNKRTAKALKNEEIPEVVSVRSDLPDDNQTMETVRVEDAPKQAKEQKEEPAKEVTEKGVEGMRKRTAKALEQEQKVAVERSGNTMSRSSGNDAINPAIDDENSDQDKLTSGGKLNAKEIKFDVNDSIESPDSARRTFEDKIKRFANKYNINPNVLYANSITVDAHHYREPATLNGILIKEVHGADKSMKLAYEQ